jgi:hypothetical protein
MFAQSSCFRWHGNLIRGTPIHGYEFLFEPLISIQSVEWFLNQVFKLFVEQFGSIEFFVEQFGSIEFLFRHCSSTVFGLFNCSVNDAAQSRGSLVVPDA